jgi:hypothetical protein
MRTYSPRIAHGLSLLVVLLLAACGGGGSSGDAGPPGPFQLAFSLDNTFQVPHGGQPIGIAVVRSPDNVVVAEDSGTVSATQNPSFSFVSGSVMERGTAYEVHYWVDSTFGGGAPGVCDPKAIDHQWSVEFPSPTNDVDFTVSHDPALTEDICSTFPDRNLEPDPTNNWYVTTPNRILSNFNTVNIVVTFSNGEAADMVFSSSPQFQLWTVPSVISPPVVINSEPSGNVAPGGVLSYDLTVTVSGLPSTETQLAIRPEENNVYGTLAPSQVPLVSESITIF